MHHEEINRKYHIEELIEEDKYSKTYKGKDRAKGTSLFIKVLDETLEDIVDINKFRRECHLVQKLRDLQHSNIVKILYVEPGMTSNYYVYEDAGVTLHNYVKSKGRFSTKVAINIILQIARVLSIVFEKYKILHRDITPDNIIITPEGVAKIASFNTVKIIDSATLSVTSPLKGFLPFTAPEIILDQQKYTLQSDIYSLGLTLYYMLTTEVPFKSSYEVFLDKPMEFRLPYEDILETLKWVTNRDPRKRPLGYKVLINKLKELKKIYDLKSISQTFMQQEPSEKKDTISMSNEELQQRVMRLEQENVMIKAKLQQLQNVVQALVNKFHQQ